MGKEKSCNCKGISIILECAAASDVGGSVQWGAFFVSHSSDSKEGRMDGLKVLLVIVTPE